MPGSFGRKLHTTRRNSSRGARSEAEKRLYELQIEMCQWAMTELRKPKDFPSISRLRGKAWVAAIEAEIESLRESQSAVRYHGFGGEEEVPYSREKAETLREDYLKEKEHRPSGKKP